MVMDWIEAKAHGGSGNGPSNRILLLRDTNGDGKPDAQTVLIEHLNSPFGVVLVGDSLYVADTDAILRYPFKVGDTKVGGEATKFVDLPAGAINHHWTKSLTASADGSKLYVGVGSNSNILERGPDAEMNRADILEVDPKTGAFDVFAKGLRNPNGLTFYPGSDVLWTVVNERDELGPDLVPDYMTSVKRGAFYGWPYSYWGQHEDARVRPQRPDLVKAAIKPDYGLSSHVAPLGLRSTWAPRSRRNFAAAPSSASTAAGIGRSSTATRSSSSASRTAGRSASRSDFVTDFLKGDGARGRPVGVAVDKAGALIVADDVGNTVWRVTPTAAS